LRIPGVTIELIQRAILNMAARAFALHVSRVGVEAGERSVLRGATFVAMVKAAAARSRHDVAVGG